MAVTDAALFERLGAAHDAVESVGAALLALRDRRIQGREDGRGQLKTAVDTAAEGWVRGYLETRHPADRFLCEEAFGNAGSSWEPTPDFWTIDALDGTRSFIGGFAGFCVQVAYIQRGRSVVGVVHEPVRSVTYWAVRGHGAFRQGPGGVVQPLRLDLLHRWPAGPVFVDSARPGGAVGRLIDERLGSLLVCGSIGLKICRVAEGSAHVFAKALTFGLWDTAPGEVILSEAAGRLGLWSGANVPATGECLKFENLLATPSALFDVAVRDLSACARQEVMTHGS